MNMHVGPPEVTQDSLYFKTAVTPEEIFKAIGKLRREARDEIDRLIRFLDDTDRHIAIEDCAVDDDPCCDKELDGQEDGNDQDDEPDHEGEPSLGAPIDQHGTTGQTLWGAGIGDDREADPSDDEPSLCGITADEGCGNGRDLEGEHDGREPDDTGIGDVDGLMEQTGRMHSGETVDG